MLIEKKYVFSINYSCDLGFSSLNIDVLDVFKKNSLYSSFLFLPLCYSMSLSSESPIIYMLHLISFSSIFFLPFFYNFYSLVLSVNMGNPFSYIFQFTNNPLFNFFFFYLYFNYSWHTIYQFQVYHIVIRHLCNLVVVTPISLVPIHISDNIIDYIP